MNSREIDALVAEHVFGISLVPTHCCGIEVGYTSNGRPFCNTSGYGGDKHEPEVKIKNYSTNIADAWEVYKNIWNMTEHPFVIGRNPYTSREEYCVMYMDYDGLEIIYAADTMPLAICLAALRTKGIEVDNVESK